MTIKEVGEVVDLRNCASEIARYWLTQNVETRSDTQSREGRGHHTPLFHVERAIGRFQCNNVPALQDTAQVFFGNVWPRWTMAANAMSDPAVS